MWVVMSHDSGWGMGGHFTFISVARNPTSQTADLVKCRHLLAE